MKKINVLLTSAILMTTIFIGTTEAGYIEPGSESDPLVSKTYVDKQNNEVKTNLDSNTTKIAQLEKNIEDLIRNGGGNSGGGNQGTSEEFKVIDLKKGQTIIAEASTEIIVRSGEVTAIGSKEGGLSDITEGIDLQTGEQIKLNHLLIVPRSDGRGIQINTDKTFIMIKGRYR